MIPYIRKLEEMGIRVLRPAKDAFSNAVRENNYAGAYFNLYWIAEEMMPLFKAAQPAAFTIVDSVDVHFAREETQAKLGAVDMSQVLQTKKRELGVYNSADVTIAVSKDDLHLLTRKEGLKNVFLVPNIVREYPRAAGKRSPIVVFIGSYAWYPNPEAVKWFADAIWPAVRASCPAAEFLIIGSDPTPEVLSLAEVPGIKVLGYVPETKPFLETAAVSVAPLRVGGGMKGKVNEAMAHGIPVVATRIGAQGFEAIHGQHMMIADDPQEFASCVISLLKDENLQRDMGLAGQQLNSAICSHCAVKEQIRMVVERCSRIVPAQTGPPRPGLCAKWAAMLAMFFADLGHAIKLLRREGIGQFFSRAWLYLHGQRLPVSQDMQEVDSPTPYILPKPDRFLEFPPLSDTPTASIILPVYNQWDFTHACLESILVNSAGTSYEVILIDDHSTDETVNIGRYAANIRVIRNEHNMGFLLNCNKAAALAKGKYVILLNNDTLVQAGWLEWMIRTLEERPDAGMVGAKLIFSTGRLQEAGSIVFCDGSAMNYGREDLPDRPQYNYFKEVDYCSAAAVCVRKAIWDKAGGFDTRYVPAYYEDTDLAMQVRSMGFKTVYQPKAVVIHFEGTSHGTDITTGIKKKQDENQKVFFTKWQEELARTHLHRDENIFRSRDRSKHKKNVLVINYHVPATRNFPGNDRSLKIVNRLAKLNCNIKYLPIDFQRNEAYSSGLEQRGVEVLYGRWYRDNWKSWLTENRDNIDLVVFVDEFLAGQYLPQIRTVMKDNLRHLVCDRHFSDRLSEMLRG